ncbi:MAG: lysophospholipid acyltransferase family protein [Acidobacteriota bacterium]|nr:lysophospholipid acyltransferase family protein [Acidobacteriota bacterium]
MSFHLVRTVLFLIPAIAVYTIVLGLASITSSFFDRRGHFAHGCARAWSWLILATTGVAVDVKGLERLVPGKTYVFVANHQSIYDIPVLFWSIPFQLRIIAKESLGNFPMLGPHLKRTGHMLVDRSRPDKAGIIGWASRLTANGLSLIVFPEGTRSRTGMMGKFKGGSILLALQAGLPLAPISVIGSRHVMKKGELTTRPGQVTLLVHDPIETPANPEPTPAEIRALAEQVREVIRPAVEAEASRTRPEAGGATSRRSSADPGAKADIGG